MDFCSQHSLQQLLRLQKERESQRSLQVSEFPALKGMLHDSENYIDIKVTTTPHSNAAVVCQLAIHGKLVVSCQRCLGAMEVPIDLSLRWVLTESGGLPDDLHEKAEPLAFAEYTGIMDLVSQELVLAIPMVAMHDRQICPASEGLDKSQATAEDIRSGQRQHSAFDILQTLKK